MSFVDLATLTLHRRAELEGRINTFDEKCDRAISDIKKLKMQAHSFVSQLNCEPAKLKERFLNFMKKLDEYVYIVTDFNLALQQIEELGNAEYPVQDSSVKSKSPAFMLTNNLMDVLSEPVPSTSSACPNLCPPEKPKKMKVPKEDQVLISFSSSTSSESVPSRRSEMLTKEVQCSLTEDLGSMQIKEEPTACVEACSLPAQCLLAVDREYRGVITVLAGVYFWVITDDSRELAEFMYDITEYYQKQDATLTMEQARSLTYCVYYDEETNFYYRAMTLKEDQDEPHKLSLFLVDTGEMRCAGAPSLYPLAPEYARRPPCARYCHLAGLDLDVYHDERLMAKYERFMDKYLNEPCTFLVDENESESIGVYVILGTGKSLNDILVEQELAVPIDKRQVEEMLDNSIPAGATMYSPHTSADVARYSPHAPADVARYSPQTPADVAAYSPHTSADVARYSPHAPADVARYSPQTPADVAAYSPHTSADVARYTPHSSVARATGPPEMVASDFDIDTPEYDDPVVAVTGYHNRDEEDICKHYKGGPDKSCFKGSRCTKKHILKHPDGWTLDKVETVQLQSLPLPAPGCWLRVLVTYVAHYDRVYVNIVHDKPEHEEIPDFGVVLPPKTLEALVRDMNSEAAKINYKPLQFTPAPGEIVAAVYPPDNNWYRARVLTLTRSDQSVEVQYVDYGTVLWVKEDQIRTLDARFHALPAQAINCVLAGVHMSSQNSQHWARAKRELQKMVLNNTLKAHVIARDFDEITIELLDIENYSVVDQLAAQGLIELHSYNVCDDEQNKVTVP